MIPRRLDPAVMEASDVMLALEQQLKTYEEELVRLRVENDQLRRSSQAFGELAERLSVALQTATRVNRRASAADTGGRRRALAES
jgi:regulator of replication initiation timing